MNHVSETLLSRLSDYVAESAGWCFPREKWRDLERGILGVARELGFSKAEDCIQSLLSQAASKERMDALARHLTVGETYFIRETRSFAILEEHIFRELIDSRKDTTKTIRIWTAGCCTGEEPYSIAMLLDRMIPDIENWSIVIHGTDINPVFLNKAAEGLYGEWSFRGTPEWLREKYFERKGRGYRIIPRIKRLVRFSYLNLKSDQFPSPVNGFGNLDLISCRNVLMYFVQSHASNIVEQFHQSLAAGGWLMVGASETSHISFSQFSLVNFPGAVFFRKDLTRRNDTGPFQSTGPGQFNLEHASRDVQRTTLCPTTPGIPDLYLKTPEHRATSTFLSEPSGSTRATHSDPGLYEGKKGHRKNDHDLKVTASDGISILLEAAQAADDLEALAKTHANQGKLEEAAQCCREAISRNRLNPKTHYLLAMILQEQGEASESIASLNKALYLDPEFVIAYFALGNILSSEGRNAESRKRFESAYALLPKYAREEILPESDGITAGRLGEVIEPIITARAIA
ncbi:MAG: chemotaxis protein CheR [Blastocatellia bacterium AA13]|nr:MAG: chemotaxis protein CheR [Blastocatellia bacterium AA13]